MSSEKISDAKKLILIYSIVSFLLCIVAIVVTVNILEGPGFGGAAVTILMALAGNVTGLLAMVVWIVLLSRPVLSLSGISIFVSVHTLVWGSCWFLFSVIMFLIGTFEDNTPLLFIFPAITGWLDFIQLRKGIRLEWYNNYNDGDNSWPPSETK